jgi:DNA-binding CsgD family transcriptional regulator
MERSPRRRTAASSSEASLAAERLGGDIDEALAEVGVPALILDRDGVVKWQNARADEILGDRRGRSFSSFVAPESIHEARAEFAKQVIGTARTSKRQIVLHGVEGARFPVEVNTVSLDDGRKVVGVFGIVHAGEPASASPAPLRHGLTPRQHQVLLQLARGASTEQIAASLGVARDTVRNHVRGVLRSLGVHSRLEAIAEARRRGLLGP